VDSSACGFDLALFAQAPAARALRNLVQRDGEATILLPLRPNLPHTVQDAGVVHAPMRRPTEAAQQPTPHQAPQTGAAPHRLHKHSACMRERHRCGHY